MNTEAWKKWVPGPAAICLVFAVLYCSTATPTIGWRDGPEFTMAANSLGIAHPAGFPTFSLIGKLMTYLPVGSIPFRVTLGVALFAVGGLWFLYRLVGRLAPPGERTGPGEPDRTWAAALITVAFGLGATLWGNTAENEVYTLNLFFFAAIMYTTLRWADGQGEAWLFAGALIYGLAAGNHGSVAFYAPGFLGYFLIRSDRDTLRRFFLVAFFFLVGFSVYLYLPIRSGTEPVLDFGNPETWQRFLMHVTDRKDSPTHFQSIRQGSEFVTDALRFGRDVIPLWFWPLGLPLMLIGWRRVFRSDRALALAMTFNMLICILFFIKWHKNHSNFLPAFFVAAWFCGSGLAVVLGRIRDRLENPAAGHAFLAAVFLVLFLAGAVIGAPRHDRSQSFLSNEIFRTDFENLPPDSICFSVALWLHQTAFQEVYRMREDVTIILQSDISHPDFFKPVTPERFPRIQVPTDVDNRTEVLEFLKALILRNIEQGRPAFWEPTRHLELLYKNLRPRLEFMLELTAQPVGQLTNEEVQGSFDRLRRKLELQLESGELDREEWAWSYYFHTQVYYAMYLGLQGRVTDQLSVLLMLEQLFGPEGLNRLGDLDLAYLENRLAGALSNMHRFKEALQRAETAVRLKPYDPDHRYILGRILLDLGRVDEAEASLKESLTFDPNYLDAVLGLGLVDEARGQKEKALARYRRVLEEAKREDLVRMAKKRITALEGGSEE